MKIYITNILLSSIDTFLKNNTITNPIKVSKYELFSEEFGTHIIEEEQTIYRIEPTLNLDIHLTKNYKGYDLLFDKTNYIHIPVISQLPTNYTLTKLTCFEYIINKKSKLKFVVECISETNTLFEKIFVPINFYFSICNSCIDDVLLNEINVFLLDLI
jgi:hypothetical protein